MTVGLENPPDFAGLQERRQPSSHNLHKRKGRSPGLRPVIRSIGCGGGTFELTTFGLWRPGFNTPADCLLHRETLVVTKTEAHEALEFFECAARARDNFERPRLEQVFMDW